MNEKFALNTQTKDLKKAFKSIFREIKKANNIAILMHTNPDMDCIGSAFGLRDGLISLGKKVQIFSQSIMPREAYRILNVNEISQSPIKMGDFDLIISVDTSTLARLGNYRDVFLQYDKTVAFDHHINDDIMGKIQLVYPQFTSCAEIILEFLLASRIKITPQMATYIFAGLASDTGSLRNSNVSEKSYEHARILKKLGADTCFVNDSIFRSFSSQEIDAKKFLYNHYKLSDNGDIAYVVMTLKDLNAINATNQDCNTYSIELLSIEGVKVSCSIIEAEGGKCKLSFRSRKEYKISQFAELLGGGGHPNAAGAVISANTKLAKDKALFIMQECIKQTEKDKAVKGNKKTITKSTTGKTATTTSINKPATTSSKTTTQRAAKVVNKTTKPAATKSSTSKKSVK